MIQGIYCLSEDGKRLEKVMDRQVVHAEIPEGVTTIGPGAFMRCTALKSVHIPDTVRRIELYAFACCTALERVDIPASVTEMAPWIFFGCTALKDVNSEQELDDMFHLMRSFKRRQTMDAFDYEKTE